MRVQSIPQLPHPPNQPINCRISIRTPNSLPYRFPLAIIPWLRLEVVQHSNELVSQLITERHKILQRHVLRGRAQPYMRARARVRALQKLLCILLETMRGREQLFVMCEQTGRGAVELDGSAISAPLYSTHCTTLLAALSAESGSRTMMRAWRLGRKKTETQREVLQT
jgi:hypothetical protein